MKNETILVVDDEKEIRELIQIYLKNEGYNILKAENGEEALDILKKNKVHLVILDVMMPKLDGIDTAFKIRETLNIPIIMLSAKGDDLDKINGLTVGADDYVTKPFNPLELVARIKSQLRRYILLNDGSSTDDGIIEIGDLFINTKNHEVKVDGTNIRLTPKEFDLLVYLSKNKGIVLSIENIYENVWKEEFLESENAVMVHIRKLREKIEKDPRNPTYIKTVWGVGYKIEY